MSIVAVGVFPLQVINILRQVSFAALERVDSSYVRLTDSLIPTQKTNSNQYSVASLLTHVVATAWGGFQIWHTEAFRKNFFELTVDGACGINLLLNYWKPRIDAEIASLALNAVALLLSAFLSWRLFKVMLVSLRIVFF